MIDSRMTTVDSTGQHQDFVRSFTGAIFFATLTSTNVMRLQLIVVTTSHHMYKMKHSMNPKTSLSRHCH